MKKCPFCSTELEKHPVDRCSDAWVATLMGFICIHPQETFDGFQQHKFDVRHWREGAFRCIDCGHTLEKVTGRDLVGVVKEGVGLHIPRITTSLDVFMSEVMPKILERKCTFNLHLQTSSGSERWSCSTVVPPDRGDTGWELNMIVDGKTINEALFRAAVKVLE